MLRLEDYDLKLTKNRERERVKERKRRKVLSIFNLLWCFAYYAHKKTMRMENGERGRRLKCDSLGLITMTVAESTANPDSTHKAINERQKLKVVNGDNRQVLCGLA
jgi:hypothetical protein